MDHRDGTGSKMVLYITSDSTTTGTVSVPGQNWSTTFSVTANTMTLVDVPPGKAMVECTDCIAKKGIHVKSERDIIVYSHIYHSARSDATLILPTRASGKEFFCMSYKQLTNGEYNQFMVVASQDSTKIRITPTEDIKKSVGVHSKNTPFEITLNAGEVYQGQAVINGSGINADITGTHIEVIDTGSNSNCRTVSVFSGSTFTSLGCNGSGDNLYQQMFPISALGNTFVVVPFASRSGDLLRFLGTKNGTLVRVNGTNYPVGRGQFKEISVPSSGPLYITSNYPIMMAQFQKTQSCGGGIGDPSMTILTPTEQTLEDIVLYSSKFQNITKNYINVVIPSSARNTFTLDGNSVTWNTVPNNTNFSYAQLSVNSGNHRLKANTGFSAVAYGFGQVESYGYVAGANIKKRDVFVEVTNNSFSYDLGICDSNAVQFKAGGDTKNIVAWEWDFGDGNKDTLRDPKHLYAKPGKYNVKIKAFKGENNGCSSYDSSELTLNIFAKPKSLFTIEGSCINKAIIFKDKSQIDTNYALENNIWLLGDGTSKIDSQFNYTYKDTGVYTITNIAISENNCRDTSYQTITINPIPKIKIKWDMLCIGDTTKFEDSSWISKGNIQHWEWLFANKDTIKQKEAHYLFDQSGNQNIKLTLISDSACRVHWDTTLKISEPIQMGFTVVDTCSSVPFQFNNTSFTNSGTLEHHWNFGDDSTSMAYSPTHRYSTQGNYKVTLTSTQNNQCQDSIVQFVEAFPSPVPHIQIKDTCFGQNTQFISTYTLPKGKVTSTEWIIDGVKESQDSIDFKTFKTIGQHHIQLRITSNNGCSSNKKRTIEIKGLPQPKIGPLSLQSLCELESITLYDSSALKDSIVESIWDFRNVKTKSSFLNYTADTTGRLQFKLMTKSIFGCVDSVEKAIDVYPLPEVGFESDTVCQEALVEIRNQSYIKSGSIAEWIWSSSGQTLSLQKQPKLSFQDIGPAQLKLVARSNRQCMDSTEKDFIILAKPIANQAIDTVCFGVPTTINSLSSISEGSIISYNWDLGDGNTQSKANFEHNYSESGNYSVRLELISDQGCRDTNLTNAFVAPVPKADFSSDVTEGCAPLDVQFSDASALSSGVIKDWQWELGDGSQSTSQNPFHQYAKPGPYDLQLTIKSDFECVDSILKPHWIIAHPKPILNFTYSPDTPSYLYPDIFVQDNSPSVLLAWQWLANGMVFSDWKESPFTFTDTGNFTISLVGTDTNFCVDTVSKNIFIEPIITLHIPNTFTPNGNTINDVFKPEGIFLGIKDYTFSVYNRWGELLFTSTDPDIGWDGKIDNQPVQQGIYIYQLRYTDYLRTKWHETSGEIYILK